MFKIFVQKKHLFIFLLAIFLNINTYAQEERLLSRMPADTTLVYRRAEESTNAAHIIVYKFMSASSKAKIFAFYQHMFESDGFKEVKNYEAPQNMPQTLHMFTKKNKIIMMNILLRPQEPGKVTYFIKYFDIIVPIANPEEFQ